MVEFAIGFILGILIPVIFFGMVFYIITLMYNKSMIEYIQFHQSYIELMGIKILESNGVTQEQDTDDEDDDKPI